MICNNTINIFIFGFDFAIAICLNPNATFNCSLQTLTIYKQKIMEDIKKLLLEEKANLLLGIEDKTDKKNNFIKGG